DVITVNAKFIMHIFLMGNDNYAPTLKNFITQALKLLDQRATMLIIQLSESFINDERINRPPFLQSLSDGYCYADGNAKSFAAADELECAFKPLREIESINLQLGFR